MRTPKLPCLTFLAEIVAHAESDPERLIGGPVSQMLFREAKSILQSGSEQGACALLRKLVERCNPIASRMNETGFSHLRRAKALIGRAA